MARDVVHISATEAAQNFLAVLARVQAGAEVVIEQDEKTIAVVSPPPQQPGRLLSEAIAMAEARGSSVTLDEDFAQDLEDIINSHREPLNPPSWE
jgi:antitoxin (DNA-binding transcriptional repressor) of toxin-antitoxin stability system